MASRELKKKRGAVNPTPGGRVGRKGKEEKPIELVQVAPEKGKVDTKAGQEQTPKTKSEDAPAQQQTTSLNDLQDENTKDTGQEKDADAPVAKDKGRKNEGKETGEGVLDNPRYLKSPREKSRERSASPFRRNVVEPLASGSGSGAVTDSQGSLASLRSEGSSASREAWPERKDSVSTTKSRTDSDVSPGSRPSSGKEQKKGAKPKETAVDTVSIKTEAQQNAYIPYAYARGCITRIVGDMTAMKAKHLCIVKDIDKHYRAIEDETQVQFNGFVMMLRQQYRGKVDTFRQVIELYHTQMAQKEDYWKESMQSMTERVNKLLKDRKVLLVNNREEVERLEKEQALTMAQYTSQMDQEKSTATVLGKDLEKKVQDLEDDKKRLQEELEAEREEVARLKASAAAVAATSSVAVTAVAAASVQEEKEEKSSVEKSAPGGREGSLQDEERQRASEERDQIREDLGRIGEERSDLTDKVKALQAEVTHLSTESGVWQEKYRLLLLQAGESERLREQYSKLESQYKALALVVAASPQATQAAEDKQSQVEKDRADMEEERQRLQKEIEKWEKEFQKKNKREPTEEEKPDSAKELYTSLGEVEQLVESLDCQKETLKAVQSGAVPPTPDLPPSAASGGVAEPQVSVVEVTVPDPDIVVSLEKSQAAVDDLQSRLAALQDENAHLRSRLADLEAGEGSVAAGAVVQDATSGELQREADGLNAALQQERAAHGSTRDELESLQRQLQALKVEAAALHSQSEADRVKATAALQADLTSRDEQLTEAKKRNEELEKEHMANVPVDTAKEIKNLQNKIAMLEKERAEMKSLAATHGASVLEVKSQLEVANKTLESQRAVNRDMEGRVKSARAEKEKAVKELSNQVDRKEQQRAALETKLKQLQAATSATVTGTAAAKSGSGKGTKGKADSEDTAALKRENRELNARIKQLEAEARRHGNVAVAAAVEGAAPDRNNQKRHEKILKELEKRLEIEGNKNAKLTEGGKQKDEELKTLGKDVRDKDGEIARLTAELATLGMAAKEGVAAASKVKSLETENKKLAEENKVLTENFNSERVLRKKYYNMVEDMKGKIRVYARARPLSTAEKERGNVPAVKSPDEYSIQVTSQRGLKEFQYDQVFMEDSTQEKVFEDTHNLVQSAVDGYNVCIFAYGQTGSGKTFTMIGDREQRFPGITPRAFQRIFELAEENRSKFDVRVTAYMLELYNERLIDLFAKPNTYDEDKLDIKKDKKGMVFVQGAAVKEATNAKELNALFEEGSKNRHTASTKMNAESSRSHLVIGIVMESTNRATGNIVKGKLSLVDLAGSERVGKTGATAEQLKEAMSINKSLSALGDVISALSSEQSFIPYRNNKLTMLMQDSLGGNAKTLMFVNISPADYNCDETVISLTYASRVKLITNDASKNADNKEIARLKAVIAKLKAGERVDEEDL